MPSRMFIPLMGDSINSKTDGNGNQSGFDCALTSTRSPVNAQAYSRSPSLGANALTPRFFSPTGEGFQCPATPSINGVNGLNGFAPWELTTPNFMPVYNGAGRNGTPPPLSLYMRSPAEQFERSGSMISCGTSQRYHNDPYSFGASQRLSPQSMRSGSSPSAALDGAVPISTVGYIDEASTGPLTVNLQLNPSAATEAVPPIAGATGFAATAAPSAAAAPVTGAPTQRESRRNEVRNRRKSRQGENTRSTKVLPDVPPPRSMRYLPPPPPNLDSVRVDLVSEDSFKRSMQRWYDRVLELEPSFAMQPTTPMWFPGTSTDPPAAFNKLAPCPRREYYGQSYYQWHAEAEQWWESIVRPLTGAPIPPPPPYTKQ